jgi:hypothetical protein
MTRSTRSCVAAQFIVVEREPAIAKHVIRVATLEQRETVSDAVSELQFEIIRT